MKVLEINSVPYGSTGRIMFSLSEMLQQNGNEVICATGFSWHKSGRKENIIVGNIFTKTFHMCMSKVFGNHGCYSFFSTQLLIKKIKAFKPDIVHLHNIHGWYLNVSKLLSFLKESQIPVVWTLHDCWAFTGGCAHFTLCKCDRWKMGCGSCNNLKEYPISSKRDNTDKMWQLKKECICQFANLTIVTPSRWLATLAKQSYLKDYTIKVINNGIDLQIFKPTKSHFRGKYNINDGEYIVLGAALGWDHKKGLDVFINLAKSLPENYKIVLIGTDKKADILLPNNIISIDRTQNQKELAEIYSAADVFVNPTKEDNYPTVNMEAIACGTPVITYNSGGCPEMIDETCGVVVELGDIDGLKKEIVRICTEKTFSNKNCINKAREFDKGKKLKEYMELYEGVITTRNQRN